MSYKAPSYEEELEKFKNKLPKHFIMEDGLILNETVNKLCEVMVEINWTRLKEVEEYFKKKKPPTLEEVMTPGFFKKEKP